MDNYVKFFVQDTLEQYKSEKQQRKITNLNKNKTRKGNMNLKRKQFEKERSEKDKFEKNNLKKDNSGNKKNRKWARVEREHLKIQKFEKDKCLKGQF